MLDVVANAEVEADDLGDPAGDPQGIGPAVGLGPLGAAGPQAPRSALRRAGVVGRECPFREVHLQSGRVSRQAWSIAQKGDAMANMQRDPKKEAFWRDAIRRQADSGLPVREFCPRHRLSEPSFYGCRRTFRERDARQPATPPAFVPVVVRDEPRVGHDAGIVIELRGGRLLRLPGSMSAGRVAELVRALEDGGDGVITSNSSTDGVRVWVATQPVDMRKGFDGLAEVVRTFLGHDPLSGSMFVFRNRSAQRVKVLWYDRDGLAIYYKRLERGTFRFPTGDDKVDGDRQRSAPAAALGVDGRGDADRLRRGNRTLFGGFVWRDFGRSGTKGGMTRVAELPDDPALLKRLLTERNALIDRIKAEAAEQLEAQRLRLEAEKKAEIDAILRRFYGPKSERFDPRQLLLFGIQIDTMPLDEPGIEEESGEPLVTRRVRNRHKHGRQHCPNTCRGSRSSTTWPTTRSPARAAARSAAASARKSASSSNTCPRRSRSSATSATPTPASAAKPRRSSRRSRRPPSRPSRSTRGWPVPGSWPT